MERIPLEELSLLVENIHIKTLEWSQNSHLDTREFLGIDKALQSIQGKLLNNTSKLTEINKRNKRDTKKLEEVENDPTYTDEQRQLHRDRRDNVNTEKQARLETLSQNWKDLKTQVAKIKQTIEKVLDQNTSLAERMRALFRELPTDLEMESIPLEELSQCHEQCWDVFFVYVFFFFFSITAKYTRT